MPTVQHPFFLSSAQGSNLSADGSSFEVRLSGAPLRIPRNATNTRIFCQQASCVYSFPNVTASANKVYLSVANQEGLSQRYDLTVPPGLYGSLDDVQLALANDAVDQGLFGVATVDDFADKMRLTANESTSRVQIELTHQNYTVLIDPDSNGNDLLKSLLGFQQSQVSNGHFLLPHVKGWSACVPNTNQGGETLWFEYAKTDGGLGQFRLMLSPHNYTVQAFVDAMNVQLAYGVADNYDSTLPFSGVRYSDDGHTDEGLFNDLRVASVTPSLVGGAAVLAIVFSGVPASVQSANLISPQPYGFGRIQWTYRDAGASVVYEAAGPGTFDKVRALQIACPGLATGVHVNSEVGSATICRFPINTSPGNLIQFDPVIPIKSSRDLSGSTLSSFRVELLDQLGRPVDTRNESYNCTIVIEYDLPDGTKVAGSLT
jgi:hypothetical protein